MLFTESLPRLKKKQEFNEKVSPEYEIWKYSDKYDLYVSNLGRMRLPNGKFKFGNGCKGVLTVIYKIRNIETQISYLKHLLKLKEWLSCLSER